MLGVCWHVKRFGIGKSITFFFCATNHRKDKRLLRSQQRKRLVVQKFPEGNCRRRTETELNSNSEWEQHVPGNDSLCCFCVPHDLRSMPCLLNHALCNKTRDPRYVHCVWRYPWCLHNVCLVSGRPELIAWWTICVALSVTQERYAAVTMASVEVPQSVRDWCRRLCVWARWHWRNITN